MVPKAMAGTAPDVQVFSRTQFPALATTLKAAQRSGRAAIHVDRYSIVQPNSLGVPPYSGDGKVTVIWVYSNLNRQWYDRLSVEVKALLAEQDPQNRMDNFPYLRTFDQNQYSDGIPNLLYFTPEQVNLLAHMACYTMMHDVADCVDAALADLA